MSKYSYPADALPTPDNNRLLALVGTEKRVLEVGCALGFQTRALRELQNCRIVGLEIDPGAAERAAPHCERVVVGDIEQMDLESHLQGEVFDVVTFADVLEHLRDPAAALRKVRRYLKPGGCVLASVPNIVHAAVIYEMAHGRFDYQPLGLLDSTHIRFFTRSSLYRTFEEGGFIVSTLHRTKVAPAETEFKTAPRTNEDTAFMAYVRNHNPEAETYKFIVKATALDDATANQLTLVAQIDRGAALAAENEALLARVKALESKLAWVDRQPLARLKSALRKIG